MSKSTMRFLEALKYPDWQNLDLSKEGTVKKIVLWLETNKFKSATQCVLSGLQDQNSADWNTYLEEYTNSLGSGCLPLNSPLEKLHWLLGKALQIEYAKNKEQYMKHAVENIKTSNVPKVVAENLLDKLDFSSQEFQDRVNQLAKLLKITPAPDHLVTLKAARKVICSRLSSECVDNPEKVIIKGTPFPYKEITIGAELGDPVLNEAVKILRLLYVGDIRDLQTKANELIVTVQNVTADPKTDTRIGKVGIIGR